MSMEIDQESLELHHRYGGKLGTHGKIPVRAKHDLSLIYTPGVAAPCLEIKNEQERSFDLTCRGNMVAVVTDGTRVLGLGDIGPAAAMPVMEGKSVLFNMFGGLDAIPLCLDTKDPDAVVETVRLLQKNFAAINLEDIASPKCYEIEERLSKTLEIPVFHDDQHGTAIAALAGVLGALRWVKKEIGAVKIVVNGAGAAGTAIAELLLTAGCRDVLMAKSNGILYDGMPRLNAKQQQLTKVTNLGDLRGGLAEAARGADVLIGVSAPGAFTPAIIQSMNRDAVVLSLSNPDPEISYEAALAAGAAVSGTGSSEAPNQVNNASVFPGIFRGAIDVRAVKINDAMKLAAAYAITGLVADDELRADYVLPDVLDRRIAPAVAAAVARAAMETGVARVQRDPAEIERETAARVAGSMIM